jgi:hypothetical protein
MSGMENHTGTSNTNMTTADGPKYTINIEGQEHNWDRDTITVPEIRELGSLPSDLPIIEIDLKTNDQRTLAEDEVVTLRPGLGFSKKIKYQRGGA